MDLGTIKSKLKETESGLLEIKRHSSVLIPLVEDGGRLCLLFEVRSAGISQPGEVCFPGGRMEAGETALQTALREMEEELAIPSVLAKDPGNFGVLATYAGMAIHVCYAFLEPSALERIRPSEGEVSDWFTVPLNWLFANDPYIYEYRVLPEIGEDFPYERIDSPDKYNWRTGKCTVPVWNYEGHCLWGISARITIAFLKALGDARKFDPDRKP